MPLPIELDRKIRIRFIELIAEVETLLAELDEYDEEFYFTYREWSVKASGLLMMLFGESKQGENYRQLIEHNPGPRRSSDRRSPQVHIHLCGSRKGRNIERYTR